MDNKKNVSKSFCFRPFEDLGKMIDDKWKGLPEKRVAGPERQAPSDDELFADAMKKVREIRKFREIPVSPKKIKPSKKDKNEQEQALQMLHDIANCRTPLILSDTQEYIEWVNPAYRTAIARKLHRGDFSVRDFIDLHGYTIDEAEIEVERFLKDSLKRRYTCIRIIHGRGLRSPKGPVLKESVVKWLSGRYRKHVRAFVSARQCDGGLGAIYVLLTIK